MPKQCYYDVLGVSRTATDEDIKRAYRSLALSLHPDKNPDRAEEAHRQFQLLQQAYDCLSDSRERAWYDRHREAILLGHDRDNIVDEGLDVGCYFSSYCYDGFDDDENGFYSVYRLVFEKIAEEDKPYREEDDEEPPGFGQANSEYATVHRFYSYWQSYCTKKSFVWVEKYDVVEAPNRRVARLIEKENKKLRDAARKKRNEEVRQLVEFVRKRDRRVAEQRKKMEVKADLNKKRAEELRKKNIRDRNKELENYQEAEWSSMAGLEDQLQAIEQQLDKENETKKSGGGNEDSEDEDEIDDFFCLACQKSFKSPAAFANHEKSKKHKNNVERLKEELDNDLVDAEDNQQSTQDENS